MLQTPEMVDAMFQATAGDVCSHAGRTAYGHLERPVDEIEPHDVGGATLLAQPSFVCANGILPGIGYDIAEGARGIGELVDIRESDPTGELGPAYRWKVARITRVSDDGGEIRLVLTEP